ncbi:hypothetical protein BSKO_13175 [Bryopsis sp. KO-2023]|nr:hypothetical protein BSKO_13175 [Bryopsis sp. KO-2023]
MADDPKKKRSASSQKASKDVSLARFLSRMAALVEVEKNAEVEKMQEEMKKATEQSQKTSGNTLFSLKCDGIEGGLMGRSLLTLVSTRIVEGKKGACAELPPHRFGPHDLVELRPNKGGVGGAAVVSGLVYRSKEREIIVAVDDVPEDGLDQTLRMDRLANEVTYQRLKQTLEEMQNPSIDTTMPGGRLLDVAFEKKQPPKLASSLPKWVPFNDGLDESQRKAVGVALAAQDLALVHGPPGTGKTTTVVEYILQEVKRGNRVLACTASNVAVDNLVERIANHKKLKTKVVRLGHPARLLPQVLDCSLEAHVFRSDNSSLARDCRKETKALNAKLLKLDKWKRAEKRQIRQELKVLAKEERQRQQKAVEEVLGNAQVVCATLSGVLGRHAKGLSFDVVVIDEAAQALEVSSWGALLRGKKAVLAGDHLQLPPTVMSDEAAKKGLGITLFERMQGLHGDSVGVMLTEQYRMNACIMQWASDEMYGGKLTAHPSVADHSLSELADVEVSKLEEVPVLMLIDTAGCDCEEEIGEDGVSRANPGEAEAVMHHVNSLLSAGVKPKDIGIITPYNAQVANLREKRTQEMAGLEISSVDGFQGREKEAVVISMVRSNATREVGFLSDHRRMNVGVTRARRHCAIVCDTETVSKDDFLARLVTYFEENGEYVSAAELGVGG